MKNLIMIGAVLLIVGTAVSYRIRGLRSAPEHRSESRVHAIDGFQIEGKVINAAGDIVAGADVFAELDRAGATRILTDVSDKDGNFSITIGELGQYTISGSKEEDGYPLTVSGFHQAVSLDQIPKLNITERKTVSNVVLQLGEKAAIIEGVIKDGLSGEPVRTASLTLRRTDNPDLLYRTSTDEMRPGKFKLAVPTVPFDVEVESMGYEPWISRNSQKEPIKLNRGESRSFIVNLRQKRDQ